MFVKREACLVKYVSIWHLRLLCHCARYASPLSLRSSHERGEAIPEIATAVSTASR